LKKEKMPHVTVKIKVDPMLADSIHLGKTEAQIGAAILSFESGMSS